MDWESTTVAPSAVPVPGAVGAAPRRGGPWSGGPFPGCRAGAIPISVAVGAFVWFGSVLLPLLVSFLGAVDNRGSAAGPAQPPPCPHPAGPARPTARTELPATGTAIR